MGSHCVHTTARPRGVAGMAILLCALTACLGGARRSQHLRTMGAGPAMRAVVSPLTPPTLGSQVAAQVDDSAHVVVLLFDPTGKERLLVSRGGALAVRASLFTRIESVPGSAATRWAETRCEQGDRGNRAALTQAEFTSGVTSPVLMSCYTLPSPAPSPPDERTRRVEVEGPVLVLASMHAPNIEAAAKVLEIWGRSGRDAGRVPEIATLVFGVHPWTGALHHR